MNIQLLNVIQHYFLYTFDFIIFIIISLMQVECSDSKYCFLFNGSHSLGTHFPYNWVEQLYNVVHVKKIFSTPLKLILENNLVSLITQV